MPHQDDSNLLTNLSEVKAAFEGLLPEEVEGFIRDGPVRDRPLTQAIRSQFAIPQPQT